MDKLDFKYFDFEFISKEEGDEIKEKADFLPIHCYPSDVSPVPGEIGVYRRHRIISVWRPKGPIALAKEEKDIHYEVHTTRLSKTSNKTNRRKR